MKNSPTYRTILTTVFLLVCLNITAQESYNNGFSSQNDSQYQKLKSLGYTEKEIYEDLGNANFLLEKYENAAFWYKKLSELEGNKALGSNYQKRYQFAMEQTADIHTVANNGNDWLEQIKEDYQVKRAFEARQASQSVTSNRRDFDFNPSYRSQSLEYLVEYERNKAFIGVPHAKRSDMEETYESPIAVTSDGQTAYFSKAIYLKPVKGIFSKKELIQKIYRTDKINGQWKNVREITVAPKHASAMHPAISEDGKRLFFASNMPGSFGEYDIYVADISYRGNAGKAKNLGTKVNTKKNDLYPRIMEDNTLVFASEGREGYGGLDLYMTQVGQNNVDYATNLGSPINSSKDEYSMYVMADRGIGYVLSNRGKNKNKIQEVAFSYENGTQSKADERESNLRAALNNKLQIDYTTSVFEDK
ncbi:cell envelope biogenesis protein OmpA [Maribacter algarum]|uniref:Cell envelope biogenesis protein OmpA n=1 Tax=Maribacter algarum (ex Zhang et al. 2020) TaxID=2578118 RepID=A0A5S3PQS0_9FLAO|nr:PD40 domain-containing protein [Maribacter algarum]TMM57052.1 cell envelope biogenesis protein OmpA [Maribacter algarum]